MKRPSRRRFRLTPGAIERNIERSADQRISFALQWFAKCVCYGKGVPIDSAAAAACYFKLAVGRRERITQLIYGEMCRAEDGMP
jgi:ribose 1,5-bisphosphokinase PhnN